MNSSQVIKLLVVSVVLALVGYFAAGTVTTLSAEFVAGFAFIAAIISGVLNGGSSSASASDQTELKTLYVGNLPYRANEAAVRELFAEHGYVQSVRLMKDKHTGKRRGFGFVEMAAGDAAGAIKALNDNEFQQRTLKVREAKERPEKSDDNE